MVNNIVNGSDDNIYTINDIEESYKDKEKNMAKEIMSG